MAVDPPVLYNGWWTYLRDMVGGTYGSSHLNPSSYQIHNAIRMRSFLQQQGYCEIAIAGVLGNAQVESGLSPGAIEKWSVLPNGAEHLSDVSNSYMLQYYTPPGGGQGYGLGILQWDRFSTTYQTNDLLGWTYANGYDWYDGSGQMARLAFEYANDAQYNFWRLNYGNNLTWQAYKNLDQTFPTYDASEAANVWASCWELSSLDHTGRQYRRDNAAYWYQYFTDHPGGLLQPWMIPLIAKKRSVVKNVKRIQYTS